MWTYVVFDTDYINSYNTNDNDNNTTTITITVTQIITNKITLKY